jgi:hypothetical protein
MKRIALAVVSFLAFASPEARAAQRTFVSFFGSDANTCAKDHPCRNFAAAMAQTNPGGEVVVLDSAGYGVVTIAQSVTLVAPLGVHAALSAFPTEIGVMVNAGSGSVVLRNIYINSQGGLTGIYLQTASSLHIEHCVINGFASDGMTLAPSNAASVFISDTVSRGNAQSGLYADSNFGLVVSIANSRFAGNNYGVFADHATVSMDRTNCDSNQTGVFARGLGATPSSPLLLGMNDCSLAHNAVGVDAQNATVTIHGGAMSNNGSGVFVSGGKVTVDRSAISGDTAGTGVVVGNASSVSLLDTSITGNVHGVTIMDAPAFVQLNRNTITRNTNGLNCLAPFSFRTSGDNMIDSNVTDVTAGCSFTGANVN